MTATMTAIETITSPSTRTATAGRSRLGRNWAVGAIVAGLVLAAASVTTAVVAGAHPGRAGRAQVAPTVQDVAAAFPTVGTSGVTYPPGHTSGWHVHPGVHSLVVLSGTLTIYDEHCVRTDYGPGETYLGGNAPHLARNDGIDDLNVAITYVYSANSQDHGTPVAPPAGCDAR